MEEQKPFRGSESRMQFSLRRIVLASASLRCWHGSLVRQQLASLSENDDWIQLLVV
jgi:hypothetical protein